MALKKNTHINEQNKKKIILELEKSYSKSRSPSDPDEIYNKLIQENQKLKGQLQNLTIEYYSNRHNLDLNERAQADTQNFDFFSFQFLKSSIKTFLRYLRFY